jgi:acetolactate synthase-1/2/3 large subunit
MASIGSALPMAIGASFAKPGTPIVVIVGDGGFQLNIQELQTVFHHQLPIKIIMLNNDGYGMIKQFQEQYMNSRFQSSGVGYSNPDFQAVVSAYKIPVNKITKNKEITTALYKLFSDIDRPGFLEVVIDTEARVTPKLGVNRPVEDQEPLLSREELESNMLVEPLPE